MRLVRAAGFLVMSACAFTSPYAYEAGAPRSEASPRDDLASRLAPALRDAGLPDLRSARLPRGDVEVRFWQVPSFRNPRAIVLRRHGSNFRAVLVDKQGARDLEPRGGWEALWNQLGAQQLFTLPDESALPPDDVHILDGVVYLVQIQQEGAFRQYGYSDLYEHDRSEYTRMLRIAHALGRAFDVVLERPRLDVRDRIADGQVVLLRKGSAVGAFTLEDQVWDDNADSARYEWAWRDGGSGALRGEGVARGSGRVERSPRGHAFVTFGPFSVEWSVRKRCTRPIGVPARVGGMSADTSTRFCYSGQLHYVTPPEGAIAVTNETRLDRVDPDDSTWVYRRSRVDLGD
jgi:hypothetical protein